MTQNHVKPELAKGVTPEIILLISTIYYRLRDLKARYACTAGVSISREFDTIFMKFMQKLETNVAALAGYLGIDVCKDEDTVEFTVFPWHGFFRNAWYVACKTFSDLEKLGVMLDNALDADDDDEVPFSAIEFIKDDAKLLNTFIQDGQGVKYGYDVYSETVNKFVSDTDKLIDLYSKSDDDDDVDVIADKLMK